MHIRLIATDLDGTLLHSDKSIPDGFLNAVDVMHAMGAAVVIASGRQYSNVLQLFENLADKLWFVCENGAVVYRGRERVHVSEINPEHLRGPIEAIRSIPTAHGVYCCPFTGYTEPCSPAVLAGIRKYYFRLNVTPDAENAALGDTICKFAVNDSEDAAKNLLPVLSKFSGRHIEAVLSGPEWVDIMNTGTTKGSAVKIIQEKLGISPDECAAFGDYDNDTPMLRQCGRSFAMDNALPSVKAAARQTIASNDEDGVMTELRRIFGNLF